MKKVELLSPAGNFECFRGAIHAGADAVYLGGMKFGARAYADNFSEEEIIKAIEYAHIYGRKVYLTLNTLIKEKEFSEIYDYVFHFYESGLDGIIIQDMGVFLAMGEWFPGLERHISTQMTITGEYGAAYLKELGADRIVPAREISLDEIISIKKSVNIEIEAFVHGAMCYSYSGQCLFSSILGGRSGNRGRCAQPCRLPYETRTETANRKRNCGSKEEIYPLSLKDMCTITLIPQLIEAGIDSFKIEGRMKSAEYCAGVTALYRKYIDNYYENKDDYQVTEDDINRLKHLYIRGEISEGYYNRHNGKEMVTVTSPAYSGRNDKLAEEIRQKYIEKEYRLKAEGRVVLHKGKEAEFTVFCMEQEVTVTGSIVDEAKNRPLTKEDVLKQIKKSGNSCFELQCIEVIMENDVFMPVKQLNDLRRSACEQLGKKLSEANGFACLNRNRIAPDSFHASSVNNYLMKQAQEGLHASVRTYEQLCGLKGYSLKRIYIDCDIIKRFLKERENCCRQDTAYYLMLPYILRKKDKAFLKEMEKHIRTGVFSGVLVRTYEELQWLKQIKYEGNIVLDANMHIWNRIAFCFFSDNDKELYAPYELNSHEIKELMIYEAPFSISVYGRIPMMLTANCIVKTMEKCHKGTFDEKEDIFCLIDRMNKNFPVYINCSHCYNIIYNSVPLSLHQSIDKIEAMGIRTMRLDFTTETEAETSAVTQYFFNEINKDNKTGMSLPFKEFTNGHFKRGTD